MKFTEEIAVGPAMRTPEEILFSQSDIHYAGATSIALSELQSTRRGNSEMARLLRTDPHNHLSTPHIDTLGVIPALKRSHKSRGGEFVYG